MGPVWSVIARSRNRQLLSFAGGLIAALAAGTWAVVTYVWPAADPPGVTCASQGSIAAGRNAVGNTINYSGSAPALAGQPCSVLGK